LYLGLDLGTSELKALLLADDHRIVGVARAALTVDRPQPLWSEQAPSQWWQALEEVMAQLLDSHPEALAAVRAIGLSGQMHGATLLDAAGEVLRPAILWNDGRSGAQCEELTRAVPRLGEIAGNLAMPGFTAPKLLWVREHEPEIFKRTARVLLPKDWLRFMLSGEAVSEMSDAAGTLWLDVGARDWSDELLAATGLTRDHMPRLVEGSEVSAKLKPELAARWGVGSGACVLIRRWCGRQRRERGRHGPCGAGAGLRVARHLGRGVRLDRSLSSEPRAGDACLLPCAAETLAPDVGDALGRERGELGCEDIQVRRRGRAARSGGIGLARGPGALPAVPAIPVGRALTAQQPECAGRAVRPDARAWPGRDRLCGGRRA
jgi:hypothetical protein